MEAKPIVGDRAIRHSALAARVSHLCVFVHTTSICAMSL